MPGASKPEARLAVRSQLANVHSGEFLEKSKIVYAHVRFLLAQKYEYRASLRVLAYRANLKWSEVDLSFMERKLSGAQFDYVDATPNAPFPNANYDVILVPLHGFNGSRFRLGHGGGWYDRFLQTQPNATKIGVGLEVSLVQFEPEPHDVAMNVIVTEAGPKFIRS